MKPYAEIGSNLQRYRINALYTQRALGEALGARGHSAEVMIQRWERGVLPVPLRHFRKLHELIGIPYELLVP